jgi:hypothetical protein
MDTEPSLPMFSQSAFKSRQQIPSTKSFTNKSSRATFPSQEIQISSHILETAKIILV